MHHTNRNDMITTDDIQDIKSVHITDEDGQKIAHITVVLEPHKNYQDSEEVHVHLTNGINHRTFGPYKHATPVEEVPAEEATPRKSKKVQASE